MVRPTAIVAILIAILQTSLLAAQHPLPQRHRALGVALSAPGLRLLAEVEALYKKTVRFEEVESWEPSHYGESSVVADGTPVIKLNSRTGQTESTVVHELFHLKLFATGFPIIVYEVLPEAKTPANLVFLTWIGFHLHDPILHWIFYPQMRQLGVDPDVELRQEFLQALAKGSFENLKPATQEEALALYYFKATLQLNDPKILARLADWYKREKWDAPLAMGKEMAEMVKRSSPRTPEQAIDVFVRCLNLLLKNSASFQISGWTSDQLGAHQQRIVVIRVFPPKR